MPRISITEVKVDDKLDLQGDRYADLADDPTPQFEYSEVSGFELETPNCIRLDFVNFQSVGFPINHKVFAER